MPQILALMDINLDCLDCSVDHFVLPAGMEMYYEHHAWIRACGDGFTKDSLITWIMQQGARLPTEDELVPYFV